MTLKPVIVVTAGFFLDKYLFGTVHCVTPRKKNLADEFKLKHGLLVGVNFLKTFNGFI
jgi:hypothetical protein